MARIVVVHKDRCNPERCGNWLCIGLCPVNRDGKECIKKGSANKPIVDEALCIGCGICQNRCPFEALSIVNLPEALKKEPIHRYGKNGFALYSLPMPTKGNVVGIIGKNAIGKTTAIKILSRLLMPNLGKAEDNRTADDKEKPGSYKDVISYFKGTEMQAFFQSLADGKLKAALKPQHVEMIAKSFKGKVRALLKKADERGMFERVCSDLSLSGFLDTDISKVSGGELQRIAIAATVMKDSDLYIFDEPTSYLDIKQRLVVSGFIRSLAKENKAVVVIEHDLIALDYISDLVNIMYGKEDSFGIVSLPKASKAAINAYLEGFLKEENVRIRDKRISFDTIKQQDSKATELLIEWPEIRKKLGKFELQILPGKIYKNEIIGIVGENGIGKTTAIRILAGELEPDSFKSIQEEKAFKEGFKELKISYKPQYLGNSKEEQVASFLAEAMQYENELIVPLKLKELFNKKLSELSGGELQRAYIAKALAADSVLVLLDEPSAYLDIEQRLLVSKVIRNFAESKNKAIVVVDHDLVFIDYISKKLIVFDGLPAKSGISRGPMEMEKGMNMLLSRLGITLRRDSISKRPRINKPGSQKDVEQKKAGSYYYC